MICVSIAEPTVDKVISLASEAELAEIRLDAANFTEDEVKKIFSTLETPLIATYRPGDVEEERRIDMLKRAVSAGAAYIDIEIENDDAVKELLVKHARDNGCKVIISYHNYEETPALERLQDIVRSCDESGADIAKLACHCKSKNDAARLLSLYDQKAIEMVAIGMGDFGRITRIASLYLGSPFSFASANGSEQTAPGQLSQNRMKNILSLIKEP